MRITERLQKDNPFVLTTIDSRVFILRKDDPHYTPQKNDRILSVACVLANSSRLTEVSKGMFEFVE